MLLKNGLVYTGQGFARLDIQVENGRIAQVAPVLPAAGAQVVDAAGCIVSPGFIDLHVHLREPGYTYKETIATGTAAAAKGGFTTVCAMPNLNPFPDNAAQLEDARRRIQESARVKVLPYGCITLGQAGAQLAPMAEMAPFCCGFSDDGKGVQQEEMMAAALETAAGLDKLVAAHCEVESLLKGGYVHDGPWARAHGHKGICSESETAEVRRNIGLAAATGARLHICHVSAKESLAAIAAGKKAGVKVSCEVTPHQIMLRDEDITQDDGRFKMNPPLRQDADRAAIRAALLDGTVDCIATDHAPHSAAEKAKGLAGSNMGVVGLETAFAVLNQGMVATGLLGLDRLLWLLTYGPPKVMGLPCGIEVGQPADLTVLDEAALWTVRGIDFVSMGKATPFEGMAARGQVRYTFVDGQLVYKCNI